MNIKIQKSQNSDLDLYGRLWKNDQREGEKSGKRYKIGRTTGDQKQEQRIIRREKKREEWAEGEKLESTNSFSLSMQKHYFDIQFFFHYI